MPSPDLVLDVVGLSVRFGTTRVIDALSFQVRRGATLAVLGPNGAGKTVLFRALIGAVPVDGTIRWAPGTRLGYVPQTLDLERDLPVTGLDVLEARAALGGTARDDIAATLTAVGLSTPTARQPIGLLSGGQFQRLLVAFALIGAPTALLLDEPTAGVDEPGQARLNDLIARLQRERGLTVIFISHELSIVSRYATEVLCLGRGRSHLGVPASLTPGVLQDIYGEALGVHVHDA